MKPILPAWTLADGPDADIVVSTRARLARNLMDVPFPEKARAEELEDAAHKVRVASRGLESKYGPLKVLSVPLLGEEDRLQLVDAHVASLDQVGSGPGRLVILDSNARLAIMVNEEDHLRIQSIVSGLGIDEAWRIVDDVDDEWSGQLKFAFSERCGYLTASLTNTGTGLRVSAMMHLAGLSLTGKVAGTLKAAYDLGVSVRGFFGEGTKGLGDFYQVSNEITLGLPETEILHRVKVTAEYLLEQEKAERERLIKNERGRLQDIAGKTIAAAKRSYQITPQDAMGLLSSIRFTVAAGIASGCGLKDLNELLVAMGAWRPEGFGRDRFHVNEDNTKRASRLRHALSNLKINAN